MEFISLKNQDKKIYSIKNNVDNKYIINFLARNNILISVTNEFITFGVDTINALQKVFDNKLDDIVTFYKNSYTLKQIDDFVDKDKKKS